ncbi:hypothetical protein ILUMI_00743 [Ignelater luminosus]|uniref:Uncharacterized protein n=1 Tax=Ignelater luminosus TaxID=2038154 RepID=A0A8K0DJT6_IGNLU|nr:hypothetical protein ILUMI_00743 [Ignelater luminosus]
MIIYIIIEKICLSLLILNIIFRSVIYSVSFYEDINTLPFLAASDLISCTILVIFIVVKCKSSKYTIPKRYPKTKRKGNQNIVLQTTSVTYEKYEEPDAVISLV